MDITCMNNPRENKDIRTRGQVLFQEQKGTCPYVLLSNTLLEKRHKNKGTGLVPRTKEYMCYCPSVK